MECSKDRLWGTGIPLTQDDCLDCDCWISPGIMGKILEDIRMEFYNQFNPGKNSSNGVQRNPSDPPESLPDQAAHPNFGLATHSELSSVVQSDSASQTTNDLPLPSSSSLINEEPSVPHTTMSQCMTTPSEVQTQKHSKTDPIINNQVTVTPMDHSGPIASHLSDTTNAEHVNP